MSLVFQAAGWPCTSAADLAKLVVDPNPSDPADDSSFRYLVGGANESTIMPRTEIALSTVTPSCRVGDLQSSIEIFQVSCMINFGDRLSMLSECVPLAERQKQAGECQREGRNGDVGQPGGPHFGKQRPAARRLSCACARRKCARRGPPVGSRSRLHTTRRAPPALERAAHRRPTSDRATASR